MLFAELFALVNSENNEEKVETNQNLSYNTTSNKIKNLSLSINENNDKKTEDLAKSLVQIFYKDIGINK